MKKFLAIIALIILTLPTIAQISLSEDFEIDYANPKEYEIGGITTSGIQYLDNNVLIMLSGLSVGDKIKIPGDKISKAIDNLWKQGFFDNIKISATKIQGEIIFLNIDLVERPRLSKFSFSGIRKGEADKLREDLKISRGDVVTENLIISSIFKIKKHFVEKGFLNVDVKINQVKDTTTSNYVILKIDIKKNGKVKIHEISFYGNNNILPEKLRRQMKKTKEKRFWRVFATSKYIEEDYKSDKKSLIEKYNELGYRDAKIVKDSIYKFDNKTISIKIKIDEGRKFYFRNITWIGNTKYTADELNSILRIKKGDIYNQKALEANLYMNQDGRDISSLYMDDGYLFFEVTPIEVLVQNDSIDIEIRMREGKQATINKVTVTGNTKTNDHVIMREIRTKPGQLFSRADIIRTQRELAQLRYFNAEKMGVNPKPNREESTVDIEYVVEETSSDQVELSAGWGLGRVVGTLGLSFNNFSTRNFFKKDSWRPLPAGDGQKLSLRAQTYGIGYQSYSASFTEPWLGGRKPNSLTVSAYYSYQNNGADKSSENFGFMTIKGASVGLGKRLEWPDDYFTLYQEINYQNYFIRNYQGYFLFSNGTSNNLNYQIVIGRNSVDAPIYPRSGSEFSASLQLTPPFSLISKNHFDTITTSIDKMYQEKYKWIEYHKWKFNASYYTKIVGNLVLASKAKYGFLGLYNRDMGISPFERFYVGGDGLTGFNLDARDIVALRGYTNQSITPPNSSGGNIFNRYILEMRYLVSPNPNATIYVLGFAEGGNCWSSFKTFNAFDIKRSAGFGVRFFFPFMGMIGLDWAYGFDKMPGTNTKGGSNFHFSIGQSID